MESKLLEETLRLVSYQGNANSHGDEMPLHTCRGGGGADPGHRQHQVPGGRVAAGARAPPTCWWVQGGAVTSWPSSRAPAVYPKD